MIAFTTLFLGLVLGVVEVGMTAAPQVARVELLLDGRSLVQTGPPFRVRLDLGAQVAPHELVAVARDGAGQEVGRARQWINRPRALAEASFVLEPGAGGEKRVARLVWQCLTRENPLSLSVSFDGKPLAVNDPGHVLLPRHVPEQLHFLRAELDFGGDVKAVADAVFGGTRKAETLTELTGVPILLDEGAKEPSLAQLREAIIAGGAPAVPAALEQGPAEAVMVIAGKVGDDLSRIATRAPRHVAFRLGPEQVYRLVWCRPLLSRQRDQEISTFPMTPDVGPRDVTFVRYATALSGPTDGSRPQIAKAVATAGLSAAARDRRRAVVLLLGAEAKEEGDLGASQARSFLERLRVPLFVWRVAQQPPPAEPAYTPSTDASSWRALDLALGELTEHLGRQRIVWVEGTWLPQQIALREGTRGYVLAR